MNNDSKRKLDMLCFAEGQRKGPKGYSKQAETVVLLSSDVAAQEGNQVLCWRVFNLWDLMLRGQFLFGRTGTLSRRSSGSTSA